MKISFSQVYIEVDANFPFSVHFQRFLTAEITALVSPSPEFSKTYGEVSELIFRVSAKHLIEENELRGPTVFRKAKDVEFTIFLPFDSIMQHPDAPRSAACFLFDGVCNALEQLQLNNMQLVQKKQELIEAICSKREMLAPPHWNESENHTPVRIAFKRFYNDRK